MGPGNQIGVWIFTWGWGIHVLMVCFSYVICIYLWMHVGVQHYFHIRWCSNSRTTGASRTVPVHSSGPRVHPGVFFFGFVCLFGGSVAHSYVFCGNVLWTIIFLLIIVLFVLRLTTSDTHFGSSHFSRYNWNIVENGVEYHNPNPQTFLIMKENNDQSVQLITLIKLV